jgi:N-acetylneuraminic acid mutarotase
MRLLLLIALALFTNPGHWETLTSKNEIPDRSECGMAASDGKLYVVGGGGGIKSVEMFDPATMTWTKKAEAPIEMHHFQAVSLDKKIYVLQAFYQGPYPNQIVSPNIYIYDIEKDAWTKGLEVPADRRRAGAGAAVYHGKIYLVAGIQHGHSSGTTNMFDVYDPVANTWTKLKDAPHIRDHSMACVVKDKLYAIGGRNTSYHEPGNFMSFFSKTVLEVDCYDFKTKKWSTLPYNLPLGSGGGSAVNLDDKLYYLGGERATDSEKNAPRKNVYCYDPSLKEGFKEIESMSFGRNGMSAAVIDHKIYAFGGSGGPAGPPPGMQKPDSISMPKMPPPEQQSMGKLEVFTPQ